MNKENLKFRAWVPRDQYMASVASISWESRAVRLTAKNGVIYPVELDDIVLMQHIGLTDANLFENGKEVLAYQGDIVCDEYSEVYLIETVEGGLYTYLFRLKRCADRDLQYRRIGHIQSCKIIGNKYQNPELLEENK